MHIGTSGSTEFEMDNESTVELYDEYPDLMEGLSRTGLIHSHHSMKAYFSSTDDGELSDNTANYNIYLSLIVNFDGDYAARVAFPTTVNKEVKRTFSFKNIMNSLLNKESVQTVEEEVICYYDCHIQDENLTVSDSFKERYIKVKDYKPARTTVGYSYNRNGYGNNWGNYTNKPINIFTYGNYRRFSIKMLEQDSKKNDSNLEETLRKVKHTYHKDESDMIEIIDDCLEQTIGSIAYKRLTVSDKFDFFNAVSEMLKEDSYVNRKAYVEDYEGAKILANILDMVTDIEDDNNITQIGDGIYAGY